MNGSLHFQKDPAAIRESEVATLFHVLLETRGNSDDEGKAQVKRDAIIQMRLSRESKETL